jgi:hypothetical protein
LDGWRGFGGRKLAVDIPRSSLRYVWRFGQTAPLL